MSVELSPSSQLAFSRPLTQLVKKTLVVSNPNASSVAFKIKTTAPKQYCVRPNSGRIEPGEKVEVSVLLQPMKEDPPAGAKCKDKFLVQSAIISSDKEVLSLAEVWSSIEKEDRGSIHEQKIRCAYTEAGDEDGHTGIVDDADRSILVDGTPNSHVNGLSPSSPGNTSTQFHQADTTLPSHNSPTSSFQPNSSSFASSLPPSSSSASNGGGVNLNAPISLGGHPQGPLPTGSVITGGALPSSSSTSTSNGPSTPNTSSSNAGASRSTTTSSNTASTPSSLPSSTSIINGSDDLLAKAKEEIASLQAKLSQAANSSPAVVGLRKRGGEVAEGAAEIAGNAQAQMQQANAQGGVPLEVVAALCLATFVFTYIFF